MLCSWVFVDVGELSLALNCFFFWFFLHGWGNNTGLAISDLCHDGNEAAFFLKLNRSLLAVSPFLSEFQALVWSGKSIIVVKWALSKHPCGGTTPVHAPEYELGYESRRHQSFSLDVHTRTAGGI